MFYLYIKTTSAFSLKTYIPENLKEKTQEVQRNGSRETFLLSYGDWGFTTGVGKGAVPGGGNGNPLQYSCQENGQRSLAPLWGRKESATTEHSKAHKVAGGGEGKKSGTVRSLQGR